MLFAVRLVTFNTVADAVFAVIQVPLFRLSEMTAILRHIEERFVDLYQSLNTVPARDLAKEKFGNTLAFLDGVIEHLSDATPV